jgi:hypothetical protein
VDGERDPRSCVLTTRLVTIGAPVLLLIVAAMNARTNPAIA